MIYLYVFVNVFIILNFLKWIGFDWNGWYVMERLENYILIRNGSFCLLLFFMNYRIILLFKWLNVNVNICSEC